jgi:hypothetical protein
MVNSVILLENEGTEDKMSRDGSISQLSGDIISQIHAFSPSFSRINEEVNAWYETFSHNFDKFRSIARRTRFAKFSRDELCQVAMPKEWLTENKAKEAKQWEQELVKVWETMLQRFPTFVLYFKGGVAFSTHSLKAFNTALLNRETQEWENGFPSQISLFLSEQSIDDEGAQALASTMNSYNSLIHLDLNSNKIGHDGGLAIASALKDNHTIKTLDLSGNILSEDAVMAIADALMHNSTLKSISISTDCITVACARRFQEVMKSNKVIEVLDIWS